MTLSRREARRLNGASCCASKWPVRASRGPTIRWSNHMPKNGASAILGLRLLSSPRSLTEYESKKDTHGTCPRRRSGTLARRVALDQLKRLVAQPDSNGSVAVAGTYCRDRSRVAEESATPSLVLSSVDRRRFLASALPGACHGQRMAVQAFRGRDASLPKRWPTNSEHDGIGRRRPSKYTRDVRDHGRDHTGNGEVLRGLPCAEQLGLGTTTRGVRAGRVVQLPQGQGQCLHHRICERHRGPECGNHPQV